jgi:hypothetical protein
LKRYPFNDPLKAAIWLYLILLIFEGALRKWFLPTLSTPLLVVRDPIALWIFFKARQRGYLKFNGLSFLMILSGAISFLTAMTIGHGNLMVAIFGARLYIVQFPLIFAIGQILDWEDVIKMGRVLLWISLPMTVLAGLQFFSPQSAWVNRGLGGDTGGVGFSGALGYFRPPGTFSFTTGLVQFYGLVAAYLFYFWLHPRHITKFLLMAATGCLLIAVPLSISRSLFFEVFLSITFSLVAAWRRPKYIGAMLGGGIVIFLILLVLQNQSFFATSTKAFTYRFTGANEAEGGVNGVFLDRFLGGMISAVQNAPNMPFFGYGIGMGTNVGSQLLTGEMSFLIAEQEWGRIIGEQGLLLGFIVIIARVATAVKLTRDSVYYLKKKDALAWMLLSFSIILILQSQWGQPTTLGFAVLSAGLVVAAMNEPEYEEIEEEEEITEEAMEEAATT